MSTNKEAGKLQIETGETVKLASGKTFDIAQAREGAAAAGLWEAENDAGAQPSAQVESSAISRSERKLSGALEKFSGLNFIHILGDSNSAASYSLALGEKPDYEKPLKSGQEFIDEIKLRIKQGESVDVLIVDQDILVFTEGAGVSHNAGLNLLRKIQKLADEPEYSEALKNTKIIIVSNTDESDIFRGKQDIYSDPRRLLEAARERSPHVIGHLDEDDFELGTHLAKILETADETLKQQINEYRTRQEAWEREKPIRDAKEAGQVARATQYEAERPERLEKEQTELRDVITGLQSALEKARSEQQQFYKNNEFRFSDIRLRISQLQQEYQQYINKISSVRAEIDLMEHGDPIILHRGKERGRLGMREYSWVEDMRDYKIPEAKRVLANYMDICRKIKGEIYTKKQELSKLEVEEEQHTARCSRIAEEIAYKKEKLAKIGQELRSMRNK